MEIFTLIRVGKFSKKHFAKALPILFILVTSFSLSYSQVSGVIFHDYNANGIRTLSNPIETGIKNVTIRAYITNNVTPFITTSGDDGSYSFTAAQIPAGTKVRLEFDDFPKGYYDSFYGVDNQTTVQFVTAPRINVNLGINYPADYCSSSVPFLVLPCFVNGNPLGGGTAGESAALIKVPYDAQGVPGDANYPAEQVFAKAKDVGSIWAAVYQKTTFTLLTGAFVKRHAGLGPLGIGGIYKSDLNTGATSNFIDLRTLGISFGVDPHSDLKADNRAKSHDSLSMDAVGKLGIGGMALSPNQEKIYVINNYDRKLYSFQVGIPMTPPTAAGTKSYIIPNPGCPNNDYRPGVVSTYHDDIYVGVVCTGETSQDTTELKTTIYRFSELDGSFTNVLTFPLNYKRGPTDYTQNCSKITSWRPWTSKFPEGCAYAGGYANGSRYFVMNPQPMVTSIAFDDDGSMIIGYTDRFGHQSGVANWSPTSSDTTNYYDGFQGGDVLRAYNNNGTFILENNATAGPLTGCGANIGDGPGGGKFYCDSKWKYYGKVAHDEIAGGVLTVLPGSGEVIATSFDPIDEVIEAGGFRVWDIKTGQRKRAFVLYTQQDGTFGKAAGLGNIVVGCGNAPIEIGNRVWNDRNFNGIQDPEEEGIDGVILTIHDMEAAGVQVGKDTTSNGGQYYFNDSNVTGGLKYNHKYEIHVNLKQPALKNHNYTKISPANTQLSAVTSTPQNAALRVAAANAVNTIDSLRDSNFMFVDTMGIASYQTGTSGETSHTIDLGLVQCVRPHAGNDTAFCASAVSLDLVNANKYQKWTFLNGPAMASIDTLSGIIKNMNVSGDYNFVLTLTAAGITCADTVKVTRKPKPDAGTDLVGATGYCFPISTAKLTGTPIGGTWAGLPNNIGAAIIDNSGNVTGMGKVGIYGFVYTSNGCTDTVNVEIKDCCVKPNAGQDLTYCMPSLTAALTAAPSGQKWEFITGVATASIDSVTGNVSGMTVAGAYQFILYTKTIGKTCSDTVIITLKSKPDAGVDQVGATGFCFPTSTAKLTGSPAGGTWASLSTNIVAAIIDNSGNVSGMNKVGIYSFVYTSNGCTDTVKVEIKDCAKGSIGDWVWYDKNKNGLQDDGNLGAPNVKVELYLLDNLGNMPVIPLMTTQTDASGKYLFSNLNPGDYKVKFVLSSLPVNYLMDTLTNQGTDRNIDSDADPITGISSKVPIDITNPLLTDRRDVDAGIIQSPQCKPMCVPVAIKRK